MRNHLQVFLLLLVMEANCAIIKRENQPDGCIVDLVVLTSDHFTLVISRQIVPESNVVIGCKVLVSVRFKYNWFSDDLKNFGQGVTSVLAIVIVLHLFVYDFLFGDDFGNWLRLLFWDGFRLLFFHDGFWLLLWDGLRLFLFHYRFRLLLFHWGLGFEELV